MKNDPAPQKSVAGNKEGPKKPSSGQGDKIQNPHPLSEKDEVKEAERRMRETQQKDGL